VKARRGNRIVLMPHEGPYRRVAGPGERGRGRMSLPARRQPEPYQQIVGRPVLFRREVARPGIRTADMRSDGTTEAVRVDVKDEAVHLLILRTDAW
jgi:hypothetical protein